MKRQLTKEEFENVLSGDKNIVDWDEDMLYEESSISDKKLEELFQRDEEDFSEELKEINEEYNNEIVDFSFPAFIFTFVYFIVNESWLKGMICFIIAIILPMKDYPLFGLIVGFFGVSRKDYKGKIDFWKFLLGIVAVIFFSIGKYIRIKLVGSI